MSTKKKLKNKKQTKKMSTIFSDDKPVIEKPKPLSRKELTNKFKFHIPSLVRRKIEYVCDKISEIEWSGILFYKVEGSLSNIDELLITALDIYPLDIGNGIATDYEYNEDYVRYRAQHSELLEEGVLIGHVH